MKKDYVYLFYDEDKDQFSIFIGTGEESLFFYGYYRFIDEDANAGKYACVIEKPSQVIEIGKL